MRLRFAWLPLLFLPGPQGYGATAKPAVVPSPARGMAPPFPISLPVISLEPAVPLQIQDASAPRAQSQNPAPAPQPLEAARPTKLELARDEAAARLLAEGLPEALRAGGLVLWQIMRTNHRSGERVRLTLSLPLNGRPYERGFGDPERQAELSRRLSEAGPRITAMAAEALRVPADSIILQERLIETCCGVGCEACLLKRQGRFRSSWHD